MTLRRRFAPYLAGSVLVAGLLAGSGTHALSAPEAPSAPSVGSHGVVGHLAYVAKNSTVYTVAVKGSGNTLGQSKIGPVSNPPPGRKLAIYGLTASSDGKYVAWQETVVKDNGEPTRATPTLVLRGLRPSMVWSIKSGSFPLGFGSDDQLVVYGDRASVLVLTPTPHLEPVPGGRYPMAVYPDGVVENNPLRTPSGPKITEQIRLSSFTGERTTIHNYVLSPSNPHIPEGAYVSPDGKRLIIERGDHTDFGGIGPSSAVDEFMLNGSRTRTKLGHFGTAKAMWRVGDVSFAWPNDEPWVVFQRATKAGAQTAIGVFQHGEWRKIVPRGIAVAASDDGFVAAQPGKYVFDADGLGITRVPTGDALLLHDTVTKVLGIQASALVWVATPT
jgi:hypothetical protein